MARFPQTAKDPTATPDAGHSKEIERPVRRIRRNDNPTASAIAATNANHRSGVIGTSRDGVEHVGGRLIREL